MGRSGTVANVSVPAFGASGDCTFWGAQSERYSGRPTLQSGSWIRLTPEWEADTFWDFGERVEWAPSTGLALTFRPWSRRRGP